MTTLRVSGPFDLDAVSEKFEGQLMVSGSPAEVDGVTVLTNHPAVDIDEDALSASVIEHALGDIRFVEADPIVSPVTSTPAVKTDSATKIVIGVGALMSADLVWRVVQAVI